MLTRLARAPRCLAVSVRSFAKQPRPSKVDEVDKNAKARAGAPAATGPPQSQSRVKVDGATVSQRRDGIHLTKKYMDPNDEVPPYGTLVQNHPDVYSLTYILKHLVDEDIGKFICLESDVKKIPQKLQITLANPFEMTGEYLMLRQTMFDLIQVLKEINSDAAVSAKGSTVGIHGQRGGGKTALLNMLAVFAIQNDWLLLTTRGEDFVTDMAGAVSPSTTRPGVFLQGRNSRAFLTDFIAKEAAKLRKVKLKRDYTGRVWVNVELIKSGVTLVGNQAREGAKQPETVFELCEQGIYDLGMAAEIFRDVMEEIRLATEIKTLVLIDNLNVWDQQSQFRDPENPFKTIPARGLSMVDAFQTFQKHGPANGLAVFALTSHATFNQSRKHLAEATYAMEQKVYTNDELKTAYLHFKATKMLKSEVSPYLLARVKGLTGGVPRDVFFDGALI